MTQSRVEARPLPLLWHHASDLATVSLIELYRVT
jgi:hypothetical protein